MTKRFYVLPASGINGQRQFSFEEAIRRADELIAADGAARVILCLEAEICAPTPQPITTHHADRT